MEDFKKKIEQIKVQLFTGIKLGRIEKEWGEMIIVTCDKVLTIPDVVRQSEDLVCDVNESLLFDGMVINPIDNDGDFEITIDSRHDDCYHYITTKEAKKIINYLQQSISSREHTTKNH